MLNVFCGLKSYILFALTALLVGINPANAKNSKNSSWSNWYRNNSGHHFDWFTSHKDKPHKHHRFCRHPSHIPTPPPDACHEAQDYDVTYTSSQNKKWPFGKLNRCNRADFRVWHKNYWPIWSNGTYTFSNINNEILKTVQIEKQSVVMTVLIERATDLKIRNLKIALNGQQGNPIAANAVTSRIISTLKIEDNKKDKKNKHEDGDDFDEGSVVEITFHLEKFMFGVNHSAADLLRQSSIAQFKILPARRHMRSTEVNLILEGTIPANCNPPPVNPPVASITGASSGSLTSDKSIAIDFTAEVAAQFQCSLDASTYTACGSPFSANNLADGQHRFSVVAINEGGSSPAVFFDWTIDSMPPVVTIDSVSPSGNTVDSQQITINFSSNEPANIKCNIDAQAWQTCSSPFTKSGLVDGNHLFQVQAIDLVGNISSTVTYQWSVKTKLPMVSITGESPSASPTNISTRTFSFSGVDAVGFICSLDGGAEFGCASPHTAVGLSDGAHIFTVKAIDAFNRRSTPASTSFTIDTIAPRASIIATVPAQSPTSDKTIVINYTSDESASFMCSLDGSTSSACAPVASLSGLADGTHSFEVIALDVAGNTSLPATYNWTVDTISPVLTLISVNPTGSIINQSNISLEFTAQEASTISCDLDGSIQDCSSGNISYADIQDGAHTITITARDMAGNLSEPLEHTFTVDTTFPVVTISSVLPLENLTNVNSSTFTFTSNESAQFQCRLDTNNFVACTSPISFSGVTDGEHTFSVIGIDSAGNTSANTANYTWTVDTVLPSITITNVIPAVVLTGIQNITFSFVSNESANYFCQIDNLTPSECSSPASYSGLSDGQHSFNVVAKDLAGNSSENPATYTWTIDSVAPFTSIDSMSVTENPTQNKNMTFTFSANETSMFQCRLDGAALTPCTSPISYSNLTAQNHLFEVFATDTAGNHDNAGASYSWQIVSIPLTVGTLNVTNITRTSVTLNWTSNVPASTQGAFSLNQTGPFSFTAANMNMISNHTVVISGLTPNTVYFVYGISTDGGTQSVSTNVFGFRTLR